MKLDQIQNDSRTRDHAADKAAYAARIRLRRLIREREEIKQNAQDVRDMIAHLPNTPKDRRELEVALSRLAEELHQANADLRSLIV